MVGVFFFFSSRRRHTRCSRDWSSDVCSSDLFTGAFHGRTYGGLSLTASKSIQRAGFAPFLPEVYHVPYGYRYQDRKSTRLNSSHGYISYAVFCLKKKKSQMPNTR